MYAFYILFFIGVVLLWFGLAFMFKPVGKWASRFFGDAFKIITEEEKEN